MSSRTTVLSPNQGELFVINERTGTAYPRTDAMADNSSQDDVMHDPNPGPSVNILERNAHMQNMLGHLGKISRTTGLQIASETGLRRKLENRYDNVDRVVGGASANQLERGRLAKTEFAKAFGLEAIIASGLMTKEDAKTITARSFKDEVLAVFADAKGAKRRDAMKNWLNYQDRTLQDKRTRRPKVSLPKTEDVV